MIREVGLKNIVTCSALVTLSLLSCASVTLAAGASDAVPSVKNKKNPASASAKTANAKGKTAAAGKSLARNQSASKPPSKTPKSAVAAHAKPPAPPVHNAMAVAPKPKAGGMDWVRSLQTWLYPVKISTSPTGSRLFETRGLAVESNYLLVPLDSVLTAWLSRSDLHFYVNDSVEARVADLDLASNVAILKVDGAFPSSLSRNQIRSDIPAVGESLAAAESRESIHGGPRFVGLLHDGDNTRYEFQRNGTLESGGFIFDRSGNLVSVVPASHPGVTNERIWASSTQSIVELIHKQDGPKPASVSGFEERHNQLVSWQEHWTRAFVTDQKTVSVQNLDCHTNLASINETAVATKIRQMNAMDCATRTPLSLGGGYTGGMELKTGNIVLRTPSLSDADGLKLAKTFGSDYFTDLASRSTEVNLLTVSDCQQNSVVNAKGQMVHVHYCTSALKTDKGLSDTVVAISSVDSGSHAYVVAAHLKGFDQNNTKKVMDALIEYGESLK